MEAIKVMRDIKKGKDITPSMVEIFIDSLDIRTVVNKPLPIILDSKTITDKKLIYSEDYIYKMIQLFYGYTPKIIKKKEFFNIMSRRIMSPPTDFMNKLFGKEIQIDINTFVKRFLNELN
ncbi:SWPV1-243 [Shearwaterpox virus]|uniref:SWPV1-243 n=1 Tax=Shearwaterpox virus TaxID=1974596 RepID=A0A1V0S851_CNPV|nr:SWPV1-243 [Shearwaterpox virus]